MHNEEYVFSFTVNEIDEVISLIARLSNKRKGFFDFYSEIEKALLEKYDFDKEIKLSCDLALKTREIIEEICREWQHIINGEVNVLLTGSFSRNTCKSFSDIDITLLYPDESRCHYAKYEELFYYMLMRVFNLPRRNVHPVLMSGCDSEWSNTSNDCSVKIQSDCFLDTYIIESCASEVFVRSMTNKKSIAHINDIILFMQSNSIYKEWVYNVYWPLSEDERYTSLLSSFSCSIRDKFNSYRTKYLESINDYFYRTHLIVIDDIATFKSFFQLQVLQFIYDVIQLILIKENTTDDLCSIREITSNYSAIKNPVYLKLLSAMYEYLWHLKKSALVLKNAGFIYSSHFHAPFPEYMFNTVSVMKDQTCKTLSVLKKYLQEV